MSIRLEDFYENWCAEISNLNGKGFNQTTYYELISYIKQGCVIDKIIIRDIEEDVGCCDMKCFDSNTRLIMKEYNLNVITSFSHLNFIKIECEVDENRIIYAHENVLYFIIKLRRLSSLFKYNAGYYDLRSVEVFDCYGLEEKKNIIVVDNLKQLEHFDEISYLKCVDFEIPASELDRLKVRSLTITKTDGDVDLTNVVESNTVKKLSVYVRKFGCLVTGDIESNYSLTNLDVCNGKWVGADIKSVMERNVKIGEEKLFKVTKCA